MGRELINDCCNGGLYLELWVLSHFALSARLRIVLNRAVPVLIGTGVPPTHTSALRSLAAFHTRRTLQGRGRRTAVLHMQRSNRRPLHGITRTYMPRGVVAKLVRAYPHPPCLETRIPRTGHVVTQPRQLPSNPTQGTLPGAQAGRSASRAWTRLDGSRCTALPLSRQSCL